MFDDTEPTPFDCMMFDLITGGLVLLVVLILAAVIGCAL